MSIHMDAECGHSVEIGGTCGRCSIPSENLLTSDKLVVRDHTTHFDDCGCLTARLEHLENERDSLCAALIGQEHGLGTRAERAEAERDRYKAALERIEFTAKGPLPGINWEASAQFMRSIAREALNPKGDV